ncbi:hypothetical protein FACS1894110_11610 [Spirochaetia bacterium]|nr:hypothetical protein FACS1894110_11610 [Spirochaetia bacterium]
MKNRSLFFGIVGIVLAIGLIFTGCPDPTAGEPGPAGPQGPQGPGLPGSTPSDVNTAVFTLTSDKNALLIKLGGTGTFKASLSQSDFTITGSSATPLKAGTVVRIADDTAYIKAAAGETWWGSTDNKITVKASALTAAATTPTVTPGWYITGDQAVAPDASYGSVLIVEGTITSTAIYTLGASSPDVLISKGLLLSGSANWTVAANKILVVTEGGITQSGAAAALTVAGEAYITGDVTSEHGTPVALAVSSGGNANISGNVTGSVTVTAGAGTNATLSVGGNVVGLLTLTGGASSGSGILELTKADGTATVKTASADTTYLTGKGTIASTGATNSVTLTAASAGTLTIGATTLGLNGIKIVSGTTASGINISGNGSLSSAASSTLTVATSVATLKASTTPGLVIGNGITLETQGTAVVVDATAGTDKVISGAGTLAVTGSAGLTLMDATGGVTNVTLGNNTTVTLKGDIKLAGGGQKVILPGSSSAGGAVYSAHGDTVVIAALTGATLNGDLYVNNAGSVRLAASGIITGTAGKYIVLGDGLAGPALKVGSTTGKFTAATTGADSYIKLSSAGIEGVGGTAVSLAGGGSADIEINVLRDAAFNNVIVDVATNGVVKIVKGAKLTLTLATTGDGVASGGIFTKSAGFAKANATVDTTNGTTTTTVTVAAGAKVMSGAQGAVAGEVYTGTGTTRDDGVIDAAAGPLSIDKDDTFALTSGKIVPTGA